MALDIVTDETATITKPRTRKIYRLRPCVQNYAWGRPASESEVAQLAAAGGQSIDPTQTYAELWMGTHPSAPSNLIPEPNTNSDNNIPSSLGALLHDQPDLLGHSISLHSTTHSKTNLPFLFKVLSINTALSIQSHPDKALAEKLHLEQPDLYRDDNHKPEMALALSTPFEALCGFAPQEEIVYALENIPEILQCCYDNSNSNNSGDGLPSSSPSPFSPSSSSSVKEMVEALISSKEPGPHRKSALQTVFTAVLTANQSTVTSAVSSLCTRLSSKPESETTPREKLTLRLNQQYPGDVGILSAWFLNYMVLSAGEAIYLAANEPHAYISGELMECMATSDNVIRAGLTSKYIDVETLCRSLTYAQGKPEVLSGVDISDNSSDNSRECSLTLYRPPFKEFEVQKLHMKSGSNGNGNSGRKMVIKENKGPILMMVQRGENGAVTSDDGEKMRIKRGDVLFVPAGIKLEFESREEEELLIWFAGVNGGDV